jgi:hypothetical protein
LVQPSTHDDLVSEYFNIQPYFTFTAFDLIAINGISIAQRSLSTRLGVRFSYFNLDFTNGYSQAEN